TKGIGARTSADITRCRRAVRSGGGTVSTVAAVIFADGIFEIALGEIRPQAIEKDQLGIGQLPEQEIADALFAAGADNEIGIGNPDSEELLAERGLVDVLGGEFAGLYGRGQATGRQRDLAAAAIA